MNILLMSTAYNLYWLGRYMRRTQELPARVLECGNQQRSELLRYLGWPLEPGGDDLDLLKRYLNETAMPQLFESINDNVQAVRGVIDGDAAELFNQVKRLNQADSRRAARFQLHACSAAMLQQSGDVTRFWQLGDYVEMLDTRIRLGSAESRHYRYLADVVTSLPANTGWDRIKQQSQALVYTTDKRQFYGWHERLTQLFEEGV